MKPRHDSTPCGGPSGTAAANFRSAEGGRGARRTASPMGRTCVIVPQPSRHQPRRLQFLAVQDLTGKRSAPPPRKRARRNYSARVGRVWVIGFGSGSNRNAAPGPVMLGDLVIDCGIGCGGRSKISMSLPIRFNFAATRSFSSLRNALHSSPVGTDRYSTSLAPHHEYAPLRAIQTFPPLPQQTSPQSNSHHLLD